MFKVLTIKHIFDEFFASNPGHGLLKPLDHSILLTTVCVRDKDESVNQTTNLMLTKELMLDWATLDRSGSELTRRTLISSRLLTMHKS